MAFFSYVTVKCILFLIYQMLCKRYLECRYSVSTPQNIVGISYKE